MAIPPSVTGILVPDSFPPSTEARMPEAARAPGPSEVARAPMTSPAAMPGRTAAFWASDPAIMTASARM